MTTRKGLVAEKVSFPAQNDDENESRAKIEHFPPQKGDENESRRQKSEFFGLKW